MQKISVNLSIIDDHRIFNGILDDINNGKKVIPVVDNYMTPSKQLGHVVPGSAKIVGGSLMCDVVVEDPIDLEPVYIKQSAQLLALEKSDMSHRFSKQIECVPIENGGTKRGKGKRSK